MKMENKKEKEELDSLVLCTVNGENIFYKNVKPIFEVEVDNYYREKSNEINSSNEDNNKIENKEDNYRLNENDLRNLFMETLFSLIYERLIIQDAKNKNVDVPDELFKEEKEKFIKGFGQDIEFEVILDDKNITIQEFDESLKEEILLKIMLKREVYDKISFEEKDLYEYYQKNKDFLTPKRLYKLRQMTLSKENYNKNKDIIDKKLEEGVAFADLVKEFSEDTFKLDGGLLEPLPVEAFDEGIGRIIKNTNIGNITPFIEYGEEYYRYMVEDVIDVKEKKFDEIKDELRKILTDEIYNELFYNYIDSLMEKSDIVFNEENLKKVIK
ncbi:MAG: peptidyl-prolyl cis-trans isomerase [Spirochaetes bacterium]|nr:peptidyl-prolyl cis-trans isomerase [Spirochaetota bacterium]